MVSDRGTTELLAMKKHDKNSMKFSIINSEGLSGNLGGIVGQNLIPHEYHVDNTGNIKLKNRMISNNMVHFLKEDNCFKIRRVFKLVPTRVVIDNANDGAISNINLKTFLSEYALAAYLGHTRRDFILRSPFDSLMPQKVNLLENIHPK